MVWFGLVWFGLVWLHEAKIILVNRMFEELADLMEVKKAEILAEVKMMIFYIGHVVMDGVDENGKQVVTILNFKA